ncbi:putative Nitrate transporter 1:2 [Hibiscus syriacus]|uniref:Nitrate transporter 1:2 n=1 Tax=Hibiscus syriacus TaxID=106335 RepID=A0A6A2XAD4_HIBSY|nr:putative Nitrate transporter 1:2 [Hibiscus syriacus]
MRGFNSGQEAFLYTGLYLVALGTSGVKVALPLLGADQFDGKDPKEAVQLSSYFNWYTFSQTCGSITGVTFLVWISSNIGWDWAFGVCTVAVLLAIVLVFIGKPFYRDNAPKGSPIIRILQVLVAAIRKRSLPIPGKDDELYEINDKGTVVVPEVIQNQSQFMTSRGASASMTPGPWRLSTDPIRRNQNITSHAPDRTQHSFHKYLLAQLQTFSIQQSLTLDTRIFGFKIPPTSLPVIPLTFNLIFIPIYDRIFLPIARRITGVPTGIRHLQRIGVGLVLSTISMAISAVIETRRKSVAFKHNMVDSTEPLPMSVFWLGFQHAVFGLSDMFTLWGCYISTTRKLSWNERNHTALLWFSLAVGTLQAQ